jgi:hypothetical protein
MLDRLPRQVSARSRQRRRDEQRRYRARQRRGERIAPVAYSGDDLDKLIALDVLDEAATSDPREIGRAFRRVLWNVLKNHL